jgi:hypothetical protein
MEAGCMSHWHEVILTELLFAAVDLLQLFQILTVVLLLVHAPSLFCRLWALVRRHNRETGFVAKGRSYLSDALRRRMSTQNKAAKPPLAATHGLELPDEVILRIFAHLTHSELALHAGLVCR